MRHFTRRTDVADMDALTKLALQLKSDPYALPELGRHKTLGLIFFNSSLRTRLSTQKAAINLGLSCIVMNVGTDGWALEFADGTVMDGGTAEHIKDAAAVMGRYCDVIGIRAFAGLAERKKDYAEQVLGAFQQYAGVPIVSLESATRHPLQSFADLITIESYKEVERPKVVLSWAPHPRALPQAVANSFVEWMQVAEVDLVITHPEGYDLSPDFVKDTPIVYDQMEAFREADFIYAKNWSSYNNYGKILSKDLNWTVSDRQMSLTNNAHFMHCLPVRRNVVVSDSVIDSDRSLVTEQAANRVVSAQAVLANILQHLDT
ncbi:MAG: N-acetylornithine carbamoyltransferase [Bacteroidota bacterium]